MKIKLIGVGRAKVNVTIETKCDELDDVLEAVYREARKHLASRGVEVAGSVESGTIYAGFHAVGRYEKVA